MSILSTSTSSGALLSKIAPASLSFLNPTELAYRLVKPDRRKPKAIAGSQTRASRGDIEAWFINTLVHAGNCQQHTIPSKRRPCILPPKQFYKSQVLRRYNTAVAISPNARETRQPTKEELIALVDQYESFSSTDHLPLPELPQRYPPSDGPHLMISDDIRDEWPPPGHTWPGKPLTDIKVKELNVALRKRDTPAEDLYDIYRGLPAPRVTYLESNTRHKLLHRLSIVEKKDEQSMLRFFSIIDDMKSTAIPLSVNEWTSAMSFAARYVQRSTETEAEAALHIWREMEHVAGVKANHATFNVLYDVACKVGKFNLAEMIYKEMAARGLEYNRYHHVSLITFHGLKGDGIGVRAAYKDLVEANEVVDTVVLNAMISSLIKCNESEAAEAVYERMKTMHSERADSPLPPSDFLKKRDVTATLVKMAAMAKKNPTLKQGNQERAIMAPDMQTYRILVNHFAAGIGELHKATKILEEMQWFDLSLHGAMFLALLKGFTFHGGIRYTHWSPARLEGVWSAFLQAVEDGKDEENGLYISKWMAIWAIRAFAKCSGKARMIDVWEDLKVRWNPDPMDLDFVLQHMRPLLQQEDRALKRNEWYR